MLIYIITLIIVVLAAFLARKSKSKILSRCLLGFGFVVMVIVAGIRDRAVGTDSTAYVQFFNRIQTFGDAMSYGYEMEEYGFWILVWLVHYISSQYMVLFFAIAIIVVGCYQKAIIDYSKSIDISFFFFIAAGFYTYFFNGARQGIACAIYSLAIGQMLKKNFIKYLAYVLLAYLFHKTAIMMIPVYFVVNRPNTFKANILTMVIGGVAVIFIDSFVSYASAIDARYAQYGTAGGGGGYVTFAVTIVLMIIFLIFRNFIQIDRYRYDRFLNMYLFGAMIAAVSAFLRTDPSGLLRYSAYFDMSMIFMWPIIFANLTDRLSKFIVIYSFFIFFFVFFVLTTTRFSNFVPYEVNPIISNLFR